MNKVERLKRAMVGEVVAENRRLRRGVLTPPPRSERRWGPAARVATASVAVAAILVVAGTLSPVDVRKPVRVVFGFGSQPGDHGAAPSRLQPPRPVDPAVFNLAVHSVVLDPGHGGSDPGAEGLGGLTEKDLTLDIATRLRDLLEKDAFQVGMTRDRDETLSLRERAAFANARRADLFLSIHVNSIPKPQRRGVETYYLGPTDDPRVTSLAAAENRGSGYSLHDFKNLLEEVYVGVRQSESADFARTVQASLFHSLARANPALEDRGVKSAPFVVLVATEMPGILAEVSCISNDEEVHLLQDSAYRERIAKALFEGIRKYAAARTRSARGGV